MWQTAGLHSGFDLPHHIAALQHQQRRQKKWPATPPRGRPRVAGSAAAPFLVLRMESGVANVQLFTAPKDMVTKWHPAKKYSN